MKTVLNLWNLILLMKEGSKQPYVSTRHTKFQTWTVYIEKCLKLGFRLCRSFVSFWPKSGPPLLGWGGVCRVEGESIFTWTTHHSLQPLLFLSCWQTWIPVSNLSSISHKKKTFHYYKSEYFCLEVAILLSFFEIFPYRVILIRCSLFNAQPAGNLLIIQMSSPWRIKVDMLPSFPSKVIVC